MDTVRWQRIARALARRGHEVDIVLNRKSGVFQITENLRYVSAGTIRWHDYDVVKTTFHRGFDHLDSLGGSDHPFIISKLGSVVGGSDDTEGVYFFGEQRRRLYETQKCIAERSRFVTILTRESAQLWASEHGSGENVLLVPTGVDSELPLPDGNPFSHMREKVAVYIGNLYDRNSQRETNRLWQQRLNIIGRLLRERNIRLVVIGPGSGDILDPDAVEFLGPIKNYLIYDYMRNADAGLVLAQGHVQHNESSKLYELVRCGVPVVSESPVPNNHILTESHCGSIAKYGNDLEIAELVASAAYTQADYSHAINYMIKYHTWDLRAAHYDTVLP